jgi:hypothetical protein
MAVFSPFITQMPFPATGFEQQGMLNAIGGLGSKQEYQPACAMPNHQHEHMATPE